MLFLGFPIDETFNHSLNKNKPEYVSLFIDTDDNYLKKVEFRKVLYLGKFIPQEVYLTQLELLETNIVSLLKKLVVDYDYSKSKLFLFALKKP